MPTPMRGASPLALGPAMAPNVLLLKLPSARETALAARRGVILDQPALQRAQDGLNAVPDPELGQGAREWDLARGLRRAQPLPDLGVAVPPRPQPHHLGLARGE